MTTVFIRWAQVRDDAVRAAYEALGLGETIQCDPAVLDDGTLVVGSSVLTMEQASTLPVDEASNAWLPGWKRAEVDL